MTRDKTYQPAVLSNVPTTLTIIRVADWRIFDWSSNDFSTNPTISILAMSKIDYTFPGTEADQLYKIQITTANYLDGLYIIVYCDATGQPLPDTAQEYMLIIEGSNTPTYIANSSTGWSCPPYTP